MPGSSSKDATGVIVCLRFRPLNKNERSQDDGSVIAVQFEKDYKGNITTVELNGEAKAITRCSEKFQFDRIFNDANQEDVYRQTAATMVAEVFRGFNCTIFAYGQTGTGKSYTMMGLPDNNIKAGIIPRMVGDVFRVVEDELSKEEPEFDFEVKVSYVEIYMERIKDLLNPENGNGNLKIRESKTRGVYIQGITEHRVQEAKQVYDWMAYGSLHRAVASTRMNAESSRSHSVFIMKVCQIKNKNGSKKTSKVYLVDLAGSEKVNKTGATGKVLDQASAINKSLSALGNVISSLTKTSKKKGNKHIPYRDSKLTRLLTDSLGGNAKTCLIVTASPSMYNAEETASSLRFGQRAKMIKNKPKANEEKTIDEYKQLLAAAEKKIKQQQELIDAMKDGDAPLEANGNNEGDDGENASLNMTLGRQSGIVQIQSLLKEREELRTEIDTWRDRSTDFAEDLRIVEDEKTKSLQEIEELRNDIKRLQADWEEEREAVEYNNRILEEENEELKHRLEEKKKVESSVKLKPMPNGAELSGTAEEKLQVFQKHYAQLFEDYKNKSVEVINKQYELDEIKSLQRLRGGNEMQTLRDQVDTLREQAENNLKLAKLRSKQMKDIEKDLQTSHAEKQALRQQLLQARSRLDRKLNGRRSRPLPPGPTTPTMIDTAGEFSDNLTDFGGDDRSVATNRTNTDKLADERRRTIMTGNLPRVSSNKALNRTFSLQTEDALNTTLTAPQPGRKSSAPRPRRPARMSSDDSHGDASAYSPGSPPPTRPGGGGDAHAHAHEPTPFSFDRLNSSPRSSDLSLGHFDPSLQATGGGLSQSNSYEHVGKSAGGRGRRDSGGGATTNSNSNSTSASLGSSAGSRSLTPTPRSRRRPQGPGAGRGATSVSPGGGGAGKRGSWRRGNGARHYGGGGGTAVGSPQSRIRWAAEDDDDDDLGSSGESDDEIDDDDEEAGDSKGNQLETAGVTNPLLRLAYAGRPLNPYTPGASPTASSVLSPSGHHNRRGHGDDSKVTTRMKVARSAPSPLPKTHLKSKGGVSSSSSSSPTFAAATSELVNAGMKARSLISSFLPGGYF